MLIAGEEFVPACLGVFAFDRASGDISFSICNCNGAANFRTVMLLYIH
jgi:hypothetical protein